MKPILFEADALDYSNNGIGVLHDVIRLEVEEERNGYFGLEMEYPVDGGWFKELTDQRLIMAKPNDVDEPHVFRIFNIDKSLRDGIVYVSAVSKTDDLSGNLVLNGKVLNGTAQQALDEIKSKLIEPTPFDFVSDIPTESSSEWTRINPLLAMAGVQGSLVDLWGGEIKRTNSTVYLYSRRGTDKVTTIRPGKNIDGFNMTVSTKGLVTRILPFFEYTFNGLTEYEMVRDNDDNLVKQEKYGRFDSDKEPTTIMGDIVTSSEADKYPIRKYETIDYSSDQELVDRVNKFISDKEEEIELSPTIVDTSGFENELEAYVKSIVDTKASGYFTYQNPGIDKPKVEIKVDIIELTDSPEWEKYKRLEQIQLTDTVDVYVEKFDVDVEVKINAITYDSIGERVVNITAGSISTSLTDSTKKEYEDRTSKLEKHMNTEVNGVKNIINRTADGLNRKFTGYTEPSGDVSEEGDLWFKLVGEGEVEIYIYTGGKWDPVVSGSVFESLQQDMDQAMQDVQEAKNQSEEAYIRAGVALDNVNEAMDDAQIAFDAAQNALDEVSNVDLKAEKALGDILEVETKADNALADAQTAFDLASSHATILDDFSYRIGGNEDNYTLISGVVGGLQTEVNKKLDTTTYNSKMTQLDGLISSKISETDADGKYTAQSTFTQTVSSLQTSINGKVGTTTYNSKMTQLDTAISARITESVANGRYTTQTTFNQTIDGFTSRVETIENWEIGGRNYFSLKELQSLNPSSWVVRAYVYNFKLEPNTQYTASSNVPSNNGDTSQTNIYFDDSGTASSGVWVNNPKTKISDENGNLYIAIPTGRIYTQDLLNGDYWIKIEKGNKATDWTPAPEDIDSQFSQVTQELGSITSEVSNKVDTTTYNTKMSQLDNAIAARITTATADGKYTTKTEFTATTGGIQTEVSKRVLNTTYNSKMTQLDSAIQARITQTTADGRYAYQSTFTQTVNSLTSRIGSLETTTGNLVNNPAVTGGHTGWTGSGLSSVDKAFEGVTGRVLQSSTGSNIQNYSSYFNVDPSKTYEVSMWVSKSVSGSFYVGLNGINSSGSTVGFVHVNQAGTVSNSNNTNFYFQSGTVGTTWVKVVGYIMPVGTNPKEMIGMGNSSNAIMKQNIDRIRIRFLNWNNGGTVRQLWVANPKVVEVSSGVFSQTSQLQDAINLRVQKNDVVNQLNIDTSGILLQGKKISLDGNTTVTGTFRVANANITSITGQKITSGTINGNVVNVTNINASNIVSGTLDTNKMLVRGTSGIDYAEIRGSNIELRGRYNRTWQGSTTTHDIRTRLQHGHLRFRNDSLGRSLYMSEFGISTYIDGEGELGGSSGTISWWDTSHASSAGNNGITVNSYAGTAALTSDTNHVLVQSYHSATIESKNSGISFHTESNKTNRNFYLTKSVNGNDGYIVFGDSNKKGLRFNGSNNGHVAVVDTNYATGGNTVIEAGFGEFNTVRRRSGNSYVGIQHTDILAVGSDGSGDRIAVGGAYRRTYGSAANAHITSAGTLGRSTSASKYKLGIETQFSSSLEQLSHSKSILDLNISSWWDKSEVEIYAEECRTGKTVSDDVFEIKRHVGLVAEDVLQVGLGEFVTYGMNNEIEGIEYDRMWVHLLPVTKDHDVKINELLTMYEQAIMKIASLEERINKMEAL